MFLRKKEAQILHSLASRANGLLILNFTTLFYYFSIRSFTRSRTQRSHLKKILHSLEQRLEDQWWTIFVLNIWTYFWKSCHNLKFFENFICLDIYTTRDHWGQNLPIHNYRAFQEGAQIDIKIAKKKDRCIYLKDRNFKCRSRIE